MSLGKVSHCKLADGTVLKDEGKPVLSQGPKGNIFVSQGDSRQPGFPATVDALPRWVLEVDHLSQEVQVREK